jgi:hypothetical protein
MSSAVARLSAVSGLVASSAREYAPMDAVHPCSLCHVRLVRRCQAASHLVPTPFAKTSSASSSLVLPRPRNVLHCLQRAIPARQAKPFPKIHFPGRQLTGHSVLDSVTDMQPKRVPTIFAPFYSGYKFSLAGRESPPGTTLFLTNFTILVANHW